MIKARKALKSFSPYIAGRPISEIKRLYKLKKVVKLASNENPYDPPKKVMEAVIRGARDVNRYPDSNAYELKKKIALKMGVSPANIVVGNGADEIIELLGKAFLEPSDRIIVSRHAFIRYRMTADLMNAATKTVNMKNYTHDLAKMAEAAGAKDKFIFITNPSNPTGTYSTKKEIEEMFSIFRKKKTSAIPVFDEAYVDFTDAKDYVSAIDYFRRGKKIIILRTFSKTYGMAGLRIGFAVAPKEICEILERIRPPFNTTSVSQEAAIAALDESDYVKSITKKILAEKKRMEKNLSAMGLEYVPSQANFLLVKVGDGNKIFTALLKMGVIVRGMAEYELSEFIRVTVGKPEENDFFIKCLKKIKGK
ncbi:MAG: histidinol-phosphate transaminase [Elusimicrobia bacterium HGW-Elusimicrobia-2]|nr:MAG: histidinol-phosphate transaminase [Elusimicrobia bacterium HGW-Elusimicrobia-2]